MIIHIPHSSLEIPEKYRASFLLTDDELKLELLKITDSYTDELFESPFQKVLFPISRLVCDVERFRDDKEEIMAGKGMGVIYTATSDNRVLKYIDDKMREEILCDYYDVHHSKFQNYVNKELEQNNCCLIVDAHSFPSSPLPYEINQSSDRPDFCIGIDEYHTPGGLINIIHGFLNEKGYKVDINNPFSGSIVPSGVYRKNRNVMSVMIEVNRKLYMDEHTGGKSSGFDNTKKVIHEVLKRISKWERNVADIS